MKSSIHSVFYRYALTFLFLYFSLLSVTCAEKSNDANECIVVDGSLTVFTDDGNPTISKDAILAALQAAMENGDFVEPPIVRVSYVDLSTDPDSLGDGGGNSEIQGGTAGRRPLVFGLVAAVASILLIALAVVWRRKQQQEQHDESMLSNSMVNETTVADSVGDDV